MEKKNIFNNTHSCIPFRRYKFRFKPTEEKTSDCYALLTSTPTLCIQDK